MDSILNESWVKNKIRALKLRPGRENSQNFLIRQEPLNEIISAADVNTGDTILEIGSGLGALTNALLQTGARVVAIEKDPRLVAYLIGVIPKKLPLNLIQGDALRITDRQFLQQLGAYKLVANIPYNITQPLIRHFVENEFSPERMALLVQKEVAERLTATPPKMTAVAVLTQWRGHAEYIATAPRSFFMPEPIVDSAILLIEPSRGASHKFHLQKHEEQQLYSLVKRAFHEPRKQLGNNLHVPLADRRRKKFDFTRRAETLTHKEWITLLKLMAQ